MTERLPGDRESAFWSGVAESARFFMGHSDVQRTLERLARVLDERQIPYAVIGAMALNEWGYRRVTVDVDILLSPEGLARLKDAVLGFGYIEKFPGSRGLRDAETGVTIDKDLADVLELVKALEIPRDTSATLDPSVRGKFDELWLAAQTPERE